MQTHDDHNTRQRWGRWVWLISLACLAVVSQSLLGGTVPSNSLFIPQIGHGTDVAGNQFSTEINFINLSTSASQVVIRTFDDGGDPVRLLQMELGSTAPEAVSELTVDIPGRGTADVQTLNDNPATELSLGWAAVSTDQAVGVQAVFRIRDSGGNLTTAADVRIGPTATAASTFGIQSSSVNTGLAFLNPPGNPAATVSISAVGNDGNGRLTSMINLDPGERDARNLFEFLPSLGNFNGSLEIRSRNMADPESPDQPPIAILPLRQEGVVLTTSDLFPPRQQQ